MRFCLLMAAPATWTAGGPGAGVGSRRQVSSAEAEGCGSPCPGHSALRPGRPRLLSSPTRSLFASCYHLLFWLLWFLSSSAKTQNSVSIFFSFPVNRASLLSFFEVFLGVDTDNKWGFGEGMKRLVGKQGKMWAEPRTTGHLEEHSDFPWAFPRKSVEAAGGKKRVRKACS